VGEGETTLSSGDERLDVSSGIAAPSGRHRNHAVRCDRPAVDAAVRPHEARSPPDCAEMLGNDVTDLCFPRHPRLRSHADRTCCDKCVRTVGGRTFWTASHLPPVRIRHVYRWARSTLLRIVSRDASMLCSIKHCKLNGGRKLHLLAPSSLCATVDAQRPN
jgi:hypothetical protein